MPLFTLWSLVRPSPLYPTEKKSATIGMPLVTAFVAVCEASGNDVPEVVNWNIKPMFALVGMLKILLDTSVPLSTLPWVKKPPCVSPANAVVPLRLMKSIRLVEFAIDMYFALASTLPVAGSMNDFVPNGEVNGVVVSYTMNTWTPDGSVPFAPLRLENDLKS